MGIFFKDSKPNVSKKEFSKVRSALFGRGFSHKEIDRVEAIFHGSLDESSIQTGIDKTEIESETKWLRENLSKHSFSENQINIIEEELNKKL